MAEQTQEFEPHLYMTVASHMDTWHRFTKPTKESFGVQLHTKCGKDINDHWNVRDRYNLRIDRFCLKCFPHGVNSDGSAKAAPERPERPEDDPGDEGTPAGEPTNTGEGVPLTSASEPLVSGNPDAGDGGTAPEEGSGVLGAGDAGHVEELPEQREAGSTSVGSSTDPEGGQGSTVRE